MRVIAGSFRSRPLLAPLGLDTRPTADRLRETVFNVLTQGAVDRVAGAAFLDLYAGSGAVGIEALSRGASSVTFVEQGALALAVLQKNLENLGIRGAGLPGTGVRVEKQSVARYLRGAIGKVGAGLISGPFGVIFLDPPYELVEEYAATLGLLGGECAALLVEGGLVVAEHRKKDSLAERYGGLVRVRVKEQGDAGLSFYGLPGGKRELPEIRDFV
jgi:16S rRNA (guanine966-N2)-methyltransferase